MRSFLVFTHTGPILVLSKYDSVRQPELLNRLSAYGKFIAHEVPVEAVKSSYTAHFEHVLNDPKQNDEMRVLDGDGERIFVNVDFKTLGAPVYYEPELA
ncbi:MAG: hypothetical protein PHU23_07125 [Dehalococcoidales bacterium]|nr:hypothetical protein [Dehalococcoidales bacterium]